MNIHVKYSWEYPYAVNQFDLVTRIGCFVDMTRTLARFSRMKLVRITLKEGRCEPARVVNSLCNVRKRTKPRGLFWQSVYINSSTGTYKTKVNQGNWNSSVKQVARLSHYKMWNYQKKRKGFLEEPNCGDISIGRWNGNQVFTRASNYSTSSTTSTCRRYSQVQWSQINDPQPHMVQKYNQYMGCIDQLDAFLNNMRPAVGGKKW